MALFELVNTETGEVTRFEATTTFDVEDFAPRPGLYILHAISAPSDLITIESPVTSVPSDSITIESPVISLTSFDAETLEVSISTDAPSQGVYVWGRYASGATGITPDGLGGFSPAPLESGTESVGVVGSTGIFDETGTTGVEYEIFVYQRIDTTDSNVIGLTYTADNDTDEPVFADSGVIGDAASYLTSESLNDASGMLAFVSYEQPSSSRNYLLSWDGTRGYVRSDDVAGDGMIGPRVRLLTGADGAGELLSVSCAAVPENDRIHLLIGAKTVDTGGDKYTASLDVAMWDETSSVWVSVSESEIGPSNGPDLYLNAAPLRINEVNDGTGAGFEGTVFRSAIWTFADAASVPDVTSAGVQNSFTNGIALVDPATSRVAYGAPHVDLNGNAADWNAGTHDGSMTLTATGTFTDAT